MSTLATIQPATAPAAPSTAVIPGDQRIVIQGVDRDLYNRLDEVIGEGQHIRLAYDGRNLELMTTGYIHERFKQLIDLFVVFVTMALDIDLEGGGHTTWKNKLADRGVEADLSYYFDLAKIRIAREAVARGSKDPADYPAPDLAVEIDVSRPEVDRPGIYAALRVGEIWRFDLKTIVIEQLQPDGTYALAETSQFLPISPADLRRWIVDEDSSQRLAWQRRLNQWAMGLAGQTP
jgi:Uma2 family endonuclease